MERNDDDLSFLSGDESERTSKERHIHGELLIQRSARAQKPEAEEKQKQRADRDQGRKRKKKKEAPQRGRGDYYLGTRGAVRKFPKSTWAGPSRAPSASCFSLRFRFLRLQAPLLRSAVGTGRTACRPRRRHRRRRRAMRSRRRRPSGAARASTTSTRSFSARSGAAPQRFVPACSSRSRSVAARSCSACRIPAQIRGACHGAGFIGCLPLPVAYSSRQQFGASGLVAVALRPSADFPR
jgi:hypothetical protein